jgi:hypothetical protein
LDCWIVDWWIVASRIATPWSVHAGGSDHQFLAHLDLVRRQVILLIDLASDMPKRAAMAPSASPLATV